MRSLKDYVNAYEKGLISMRQLVEFADENEQELASATREELIVLFQMARTCLYKLEMDVVLRITRIIDPMIRERIEESMQGD